MLLKLVVALLLCNFGISIHGFSIRQPMNKALNHLHLRRPSIGRIASGSDGISSVLNKEDLRNSSVGLISFGNLTDGIPSDGNLTRTSTTKPQYDWKEFVPQKSGIGRFIHWLITGSSSYLKPSEDEIKQNMASLARLLLLLREYEETYGIPKTIGGPQVQRQVLQDLIKELYGSGCPSWVLETVMTRVAEGMTGRKGVQLMLLPHKCFVYYPSNPSKDSPEGAATSMDMFKIASDFFISKLGAMEQVAVRLASFASNTKSVERLDPASFQMLGRDKLLKVKREAVRREAKSMANVDSPNYGHEQTHQELAAEILNLASSTYGLFYFLNSEQFQTAIDSATDPHDKFWKVSDSTREVFTRLAAHEAACSVRRIRTMEKVLYSPNIIRLFRILSAAGASALWFQGSVYDMIASATLAVSVDYVEAFWAHAFEERLLTEVVASVWVGIIAGLLSMLYPEKFSFAAIVFAAVANLLQGFKVVFAVIEVMSRNIVTGSARLLEGLLFTGLISYSLKFGLHVAFRIINKFGALGHPIPQDYMAQLLLSSGHGIDPQFFPILLPFAAVAWSGLFRPSYADLPLMMLHVVLAVVLSSCGAPMFVAAMSVTFLSGLISRFTGRQALGNTMAGLYALMPGAYMAKALLHPSNRADFIEGVLLSAITIGLGGWTGTILCSPTILGKSSGFQGRSIFKSHKKEAILYF